MTRPDKLLMIGLAAAAYGCKPSVQEMRPNIIFILTDDQRWDALGYAGNEYIHTPNLDSLASHGIYFPNTYATTALSCASRASILTGMYASGSGIHDFSTAFTEEQFARTYPMLLRDAGYYTGFIGKFGVGQKYDGIPEKFDFWRSFPGQYDSLRKEFRHSDAKDLENEGRIRWRYRFSSSVQYQNTVRKYYSLVSGVDREIGNMMSALKSKGLDKNTVIIFMGDNGFYLGEHGLAGKWFAHEESARIPFFIYDPRSRSGGIKEEHLALNIDIAPTILGLAGVGIPSGMQGTDLSPLMSGRKIHWRKDFLYEHRYNPEGVHIPSCEGIITGRFKLLRYFADGQEWWEMYDLEKDRGETTNIAGREEYRSRQKRLEKRLDMLKLEAGAAN